MADTISKTEETLTIRWDDTNEGLGNPHKKGEGKGNRKGQIRGRNGRQIMNTSFRKIASVGVGIRLGKQANEVVGAYTGRRFRQQRVQNTMQLGMMAYGVAQFGPLGIAYAAGNLGYQQLNHSIEVANQNLKSDVARRRSGNISRNGSRMSGNKI